MISSRDDTLPVGDKRIAVATKLEMLIRFGRGAPHLRDERREGAEKGERRSVEERTNGVREGQRELRDSLNFVIHLGLREEDRRGMSERLRSTSSPFFLTLRIRSVKSSMPLPFSLLLVCEIVVYSTDCLRVSISADL